MRDRNATTWLVAALLGILQFAGFASAGFLRGDWRIDEAHKISETVFLRYVLEGDIRNEEWFCNRIERANPPVGKYILGTGILLSGAPLPARPSLSTGLGPDYFVPAIFPAETSRPWLNARGAARNTALVCTSITGAMIFVLVARLLGVWCGVAAWLAWTTSPVVETYGATATFDPILTMLVVAAAVPALRPGHLTASAAVRAGVLAGLAAATRLSGALALVALAPRFASTTRRLRLGSCVLISSVLTLVVVDPFLWGSVAECAASLSESSRWRPVGRMIWRIEDLAALSEMLHQRGAGEWNMSKAQFAIEHLAGSVPGLMTLCVAFVSLLSFYQRPHLRALLLWAAITGAGLIAWLPFPWPRYLTTPAAAMAVLAGCGVSAFLPRKLVSDCGHSEDTPAQSGGAGETAPKPGELRT